MVKSMIILNYVHADNYNKIANIQHTLWPLLRQQNKTQNRAAYYRSMKPIVLVIAS